MAAFTISVIRVRPTDLVDVLSYDHKFPATDKAWRRPLNYEVLVGSHIPFAYQHDCGALVTTILRAEPCVEKITFWLPRAEYCWIADADIYDIKPYVRRGKGNTPVEALVALIRDLYK